MAWLSERRLRKVWSMSEACFLVAEESNARQTDTMTVETELGTAASRFFLRVLLSSRRSLHAFSKEESAWWTVWRQASRYETCTVQLRWSIRQALRDVFRESLYLYHIGQCSTRHVAQFWVDSGPPSWIYVLPGPTESSITWPWCWLPLPFWELLCWWQSPSSGC